MQIFFSIIQCSLLTFSIFLFIKSVFKRDIFYLIMGVGALSFYFGIRCVLNDQFIIAILLGLVAYSLGFYCDNKVNKEVFHHDSKW